MRSGEKLALNAPPNELRCIIGKHNEKKGETLI